MITLREQRKNRDAEFNRINSKLKSFNERSFKDPDDDTFWEPVVDKAGNGLAIVRFMPVPPQDYERDKEALPIVRWWSHGFQYPAVTGQWYIEKSRTSLGEDDPCGEMNSMFWNSGDERQKRIVTGDPNAKPKAIPGSKRKENLAAGLYIVQHDARPSDNGKLFRYKFGPKIFAKLQEAQNPKNPLKAPIDPFDLGEKGANFVLVISKNDGGQRSYDSSEFGPAESLFSLPNGEPDYDKLEALYAQCYSLADLVDPKKFKTYEKLKERLVKIFGTEDFAAAVSGRVAPPTFTSVESKPAVRTTAKPVVATHDETPPWEDNADDSDISEFTKLLQNQ